MLWKGVRTCYRYRSSSSSAGHRGHARLRRFIPHDGIGGFRVPRDVIEAERLRQRNAGESGHPSRELDG